jgi:hypothetical protein
MKFDSTNTTNLTKTNKARGELRFSVTGVTSGAETGNPSEEPEFTPAF